MPNPRFPKLELLELRDDFIRFKVTETDASVANALRRVLIAESRRSRSTSDCDCDCDEFCPHCAVVFELDVAAPPGNSVVAVTSNDLLSSCDGVHAVNFSSHEEQANAQDTGVIIAKLGPLQRIKLSAVARLGIGKEHAKWSPVAVATFQYEPIITVHDAAMHLLSQEQKTDLVKSCPTDVYTMDEITSGDLVVVADAAKCVFCDECVKVANAFKADPEDDAAVCVDMRDDVVVYSVETTGQLRPEDLVVCALDIVRENLQQLKAQCLELSQDDEPFRSDDAPPKSALE